MTTMLAAPAEEVWRIVGDFGAVEEYLEIVQEVEVVGEGAGAKRTMRLTSGEEVVERLEERDEAKMRMSYAVLGTPLPVTEYVATIGVDTVDRDRSSVEWSSTFKARGASDEAAEAAVTGLYRMGFEGLRQALSVADRTARPSKE